MSQSKNKKAELVIRCPKCEAVIDALSYDCLQSGDGTAYIEGADKIFVLAPGESSGMHSPQFYCPECGELLTKDDKRAERFLKGEIDLKDEVLTPLPEQPVIGSTGAVQKELTLSVQDAIKRLIECGDQNVCIAIWSDDDVIDRARAKGYLLTGEQCGKILTQVDRKQDASEGITWASIDEEVSEYIDRHKGELSTCKPTDEDEDEEENS